MAAGGQIRLMACRLGDKQKVLARRVGPPHMGMTQLNRVMTRRLGKLFATMIGAVLVVMMGAHPASAAVFPYRIDMQTCDVSGAGTDSYVSAKIFGTAGSSGGWIGLNTPNHDDFERGNVDAFYFNLPTNIGTITSVYVSFVPDGSNAA
jgi:hypothetical protein